MINTNYFTMNFMSAFFCRKKHSWDRSRKLFLFLLFSIAFLNVENLHAQTDHINGQVLDQDGAPLIGVTVAVKDKNTGVFTDEAGLFSIRAVNGDILIFTMISMKTTEVKVEKGKPIRIIMKPDEATLEEVVVVGYGKQKKVTITGSVSSIDMDDIKVPVANLSNAFREESLVLFQFSQAANQDMTTPLSQSVVSEHLPGIPLPW